MSNQQTNPQSYDLVIVGGGPIGLACAIAASKADLNYLVLEKGVLVNSLFNFPTNMTYFSTSVLLEIGEVPFISHSDKPTRRESLEYYRRVQQSWNININYYEEVKKMVAHPEEGYLLTSSKATYHASHVIIATGFYDTPRSLEIPGEDLPKVRHYYDEAHRYVGQNLVVIGAANSACDIAMEAYHKGAIVTMVVRGEAISPRVKYWIKPNIENRIKEGSIKALFNTQVKEIRENELLLEGPDGPYTIPNDFVLAMTGYKPNYPLLERLGIAIQDDEYDTPMHDPETLESNLPGVYLAGVVNGGRKTNKYFIENTRVHADIILANILEKKKISTEN